MTEDKKPQAKIIDTKSLYDGFFKINELTIEMDRHEGGTQTVKRVSFERGNAVGIIGYDAQRDEVLMVNEMRPGMLAAGEYPFSDSLPAGMIDKGETAIEAAVRETEEETGEVLENPRLIHDGAFVSAGGTSEKISLVIGNIDARKAGGIHGEKNEGENIKSVVLSADEFIARAENGGLKDMKTLVSAFWLALHRDELRDGAPVIQDAAPENTQKYSDLLDGGTPAPEATTKQPQAEITARKTLYDGVFKIEELTVDMDLHEGGKQTLKRLNFERGNSVAMLGYDPKRDEVVLINEMRSGMLAAGEYPFSDSVPAAMLGKDENVIDAAVARMSRETGLTLQDPKVIHPGAFVSAGGTSEKIALVMGTIDASEAGGIHGRPDKGENIKTVVLKSDEFIARAEDGRLRDMKSLAFAFWLALHRDELRENISPPDSIPGDAGFGRISKLG